MANITQIHNFSLSPFSLVDIFEKMKELKDQGLTSEVILIGTEQLRCLGYSEDRDLDEFLKEKGEFFGLRMIYDKESPNHWEIWTVR